MRYSIGWVASLPWPRINNSHGPCFPRDPIGALLRTCPGFFHGPTDRQFGTITDREGFYSIAPPRIQIVPIYGGAGGLVTGRGDTVLSPFLYFLPAFINIGGNMPAKKIKTPVKQPGVDDVYIVVEGSQRVYCFNGPTFYEWVNQRRVAIGERKTLVFLTEFPLPRHGRFNLDYNDSRDEKDNWGDNGKGLYFGRYCPFQGGVWPYNGVLVLKNGKIFVPPIQEVTRVVREYVDVVIDATPDPVILTKPAPTKKRRTR